GGEQRWEQRAAAHLRRGTQARGQALLRGARAPGWGPALGGLRPPPARRSAPGGLPGAHASRGERTARRCERADAVQLTAREPGLLAPPEPLAYNGRAPREGGRS